MWHLQESTHEWYGMITLTPFKSLKSSELRKFLFATETVVWQCANKYSLQKSSPRVLFGHEADCVWLLWEWSRMKSRIRSILLRKAYWYVEPPADSDIFGWWPYIKIGGNLPPTSNNRGQTPRFSAISMPFSPKNGQKSRKFGNKLEKMAIFGQIRHECIRDFECIIHFANVMAK